MPHITPEINLGHILTAVAMIASAVVVYGGQQNEYGRQQAEAREFRAWLVRHDERIAFLLDRSAAHDLTDTQSIEDRKHLNKALDELKSGQGKILTELKSQ